VHYVDLPTDGLSRGSGLVFTFFWPQANKWEGTDYPVAVIEKTASVVRSES
jgi:glucoamylase